MACGGVATVGRPEKAATPECAAMMADDQSSREAAEFRRRRLAWRPSRTQGTFRRELRVHIDS